jgi:uncharacterized damage-inducible protein DinB
MTEKEIFIKRMENEFPITIKVIKAFPADKADFKPHERSQSAKQVIQTMISEIKGMINMLHGDEKVFYPVEVPSLEEAINMYEKEYAHSLQFIKDTPDSDLEKPLEGMMGKFFARRVDGAWMFLNDSIHHRGQLSVYIRMAGGKVPSIYGPSADENPFK